MAVTRTERRLSDGTRLVRYHETGSDDTQLVVSTDAGKVTEILHAEVNYDAAPTHSGITYVLNSGAGAAFDHTFKTSASNDQNDDFFPTRDAENDLLLMTDDVFDVTAPAGGAGIAASIVIYAKEWD